jgi:hypothetical protein
MKRRPISLFYTNIATNAYDRHSYISDALLDNLKVTLSFLVYVSLHRTKISTHVYKFTSSHDRFRPCSRVSSGGLFIFNYNPKAITKTEYSTLISNKSHLMRPLSKVEIGRGCLLNLQSCILIPILSYLI